MSPGREVSRGRKTGLWPRLLSLVSGQHALALADQAVVSGTSFLTTVLIARWTDASQLGTYAIGISVLASLLTVQESLILLPYSIQRHQPAGTSAEHAGGSLILSVLLSAVGMFVLIAGAAALSAQGAGEHIVTMIWAISGVAPFALIREFGRRYAFARLQVAQALILDIAVAIIQVAGLIWLGWSGQMSAVAACAALAGACGLTAIGWLYVARRDFAIRAIHVRATLRQSWDLAKWLFIGRMTMVMQGYIPYWLSIAIAGATVTGVFAACMSILAFANPLMFGFANILTPRSVLAWKNGGKSGLINQTVRDAFLLGVLMAAFCASVLLLGEQLMHFLYRGAEYEGHAHTLTVLALAMMVQAIGMPASSALGAMERPRAIIGVGAAAAMVTLVLVWWFMSRWGLSGAAFGMLAGNLVGVVGWWVMLVLARHKGFAYA